MKKLASSKACHVMTVQTGKRSFRELGADIILNLQAGDTRRFSTKELCNFFDDMDDKIKREKVKKVEDWFDSRRREVAWYTRGLRVTVPKRFLVGSVMLEGPAQNIKVRRAIANG